MTMGICTAADFEGAKSDVDFCGAIKCGADCAAMDGCKRIPTHNVFSFFMSQDIEPTEHFWLSSWSNEHASGVT